MGLESAGKVFLVCLLQRESITLGRKRKELKEDIGGYVDN